REGGWDAGEEAIPSPVATFKLTVISGNGTQDTTKLAKLLRPFPAEGMLAYRVSALVNNPKNDAPQCVEAIR
ncbi:MAG TPA: hypothetical protein VKE94_05695, partial [Gemmataceae bacterium]|nr:hypothetical protein [Gemmataceae bacterium]